MANQKRKRTKRQVKNSLSILEQDTKKHLSGNWGVFIMCFRFLNLKHLQYISKPKQNQNFFAKAGRKCTPDQPPQVAKVGRGVFLTMPFSNKKTPQALFYCLRSQKRGNFAEIFEFLLILILLELTHGQKQCSLALLNP